MTAKRGYGAVGQGSDGGGAVRKRPRPTLTVAGKRKREVAPDSGSESEVDLKRLAITPRYCASDNDSAPVPQNIYTKQNLELRECHFLRQQRKIMGRHTEYRRSLEAERAKSDVHAAIPNAN